MKTKIEVTKADITTLDVDAIVNAANESLLGGGGVDGAIHNAAGPELLAECQTLNGCEFGKAKITKGYNLSAQFVIHTVGPIYGYHEGKEPQILHNCYRNSLKQADENALTSIAFPGISTGVFSYPKIEAAQIANQAITDYFNDHDNTNIKKVILVAYSEEDKQILDAEFQKHK